MKRFVIIFLLSIPLFSDELNWERVNSCPVGNMAFVEEVLSEMTLEEKSWPNNYGRFRFY